MRHCLFLCVSLGLVACADDLQAIDEGPDAAPSLVVTTPQPDGSKGSRVAAVSETAWVYFDLDTARDVDAAGGWDLAFRRFNVMLNGGVSGSANVAVALADAVSFEGMSVAPGAEYVTDATEGLAFDTQESWYAYDPTTHKLSPRDRVYAVRSSSGAYFKLRFSGYYDDAGTSGYPAFRWAAIAAPGGGQ